MQQACLWNKTSVWECVCESGIAKHLYVLPFLSNTSRAPALEAVHSKSQAGFALVASGLCRAPLHEKALKGARGSCFPEHGGTLRTGSWTRCISASAAQRFRQSKRRHRTGRLNTELWKVCIISRLFQSAWKQQRPVCKCRDFHS